MTRLSRRTLLGAAGAAAVGTGLGSLLGGGAAQAAALTSGIDYSWGRPRPSKIVEAGYTFVCRYVSWNTTGKNLTRTEADALRAAGLDIVANWEYTASEALDGYDAGARNAEEAHRQAVACGMPADRPIYLSVDFDASQSQQTAINAYFDGAASVLGRGRVGAYAGYYVLDRLFDAGKISWGWQTYAWSGGNWDSRAGLRQVQNGITVDGADCDRNEAHKSDFGQWGNNPRGTANVYGILADGRITYSAIDAATGNRLSTTISTTKLGFTPKAMATLNFNTLVVASTGGDLYRVDIVSNKDTVTFSKTKFADSGWAYDHLAYDGYGHLFGISGANKTLRRIMVTVGTHSFQVDTSAVVGDGFNLNTLTTTGSNWILGSADDGRLLSYKISGGDDPWTGYLLKGDGWGGVTHLLSPGGGVYYGRYATGSLYHYWDRSPYNGGGGDIAYYLDDPVDTSGWTQVLLSAQPRTVS